jgi:hypothetical protein
MKNILLIITTMSLHELLSSSFQQKDNDTNLKSIIIPKAEKPSLHINSFTITKGIKKPILKKSVLHNQHNGTSAFNSYKNTKNVNESQHANNLNKFTKICIRKTNTYKKFLINIFNSINKNKEDIFAKTTFTTDLLKENFNKNKDLQTVLSELQDKHEKFKTIYKSTI